MSLAVDQKAPFRDTRRQAGASKSVNKGEGAMNDLISYIAQTSAKFKKRTVLEIIE
jgi:hypothetical protein